MRFATVIIVPISKQDLMFSLVCNICFGQVDLGHFLKLEIACNTFITRPCSKILIHVFVFDQLMSDDLSLLYFRKKLAIARNFARGNN